MFHHLVVVFESLGVVAQDGVGDGEVKVCARDVGVNLQHLLVVCRSLLVAFEVAIDNAPIEEGVEVGAVALYRLVEHFESLLVALLLHQKYSLLVVALGVVAIGAYRLVETLVRTECVARTEQCNTSIDVCLRVFVRKAQDHIEIHQRLDPLLVPKVCYTPRIVRPHKVGAQLDGARKVAHGIFVVAHLGIDDTSVVECFGIDGVYLDGFREVVLGTQEVAKSEFCISPEEVRLVGLLVGTNENVENVDSLLVVIRGEHIPTRPSDIALVVLCVGFPRAQYKQSDYYNYNSSQLSTLNSQLSTFNYLSAAIRSLSAAIFASASRCLFLSFSTTAAGAFATNLSLESLPITVRRKPSK